jgi:ABC-type lipoprotein export system ATPase subunit
LFDAFVQRAQHESSHSIVVPFAGFVFQTFNLIATMSAFENVELPQIINGVDEDVRRERSMELLECAV